MKFGNAFFSTARISVLSLIFFNTDVFAATVPLEVFGHLPSIENVAISPDGSRIAFIRTKGEDRFVQIMSVDDHKVLVTGQVAQVKVRDITWADNDNILFTISTTDQAQGVLGTKSENYVLATYSLKTKQLINPMRNFPDRDEQRGGKSTVTMNTIVGSPVLRKIGNYIMVYIPGLSTDDEGRLKPTLCKFKIGVNLAYIVERGAEADTSWLVDKDGKIVATDEYSQDDRRWNLRLRVDGKLKQVISEHTEIGTPDVAGISPDGDAVWVSATDGDTNQRIWKAVAFKDGVVSGSVPDANRYDSFLSDRYGSRIIAGWKKTGDQSIEFLDSHVQETWDLILANFPDSHVQFVSASDDYKKWAMRVEVRQRGYAFIYFDANTFKFSQIGPVYDGLTTIADVKPINYKATDGMTIPGFVTLPPGREPKNLPLVVMPHGGPESRDTGNFDWWAQALAAQGYVVLQPNFRGSDLDWSVMSAGFGEWGRKMQTDLSDGVSQLVKDRLVDPKRVCIVGASYGGYAALAGSTLDAGVYRCAVSVAGVSDLVKFRQHLIDRADRHDSSGTRYFDRYLGAKGADDPVLKLRSPLQGVDKVDIPILLIHGKDDTVVPYEQSELMFKVLKKANKQVEFVTLKHEDHWLSHSDTRLQMLQATVDFLLKNNPPN